MFRITDGKGFHITFPNRWTVSVQFGVGNYCDNKNNEAALYKDYRAECLRVAADGCQNAEVAAWGPDGDMIQIESDTVAGWKDPAWVLKFMNEIAAK